MVYLDDEVETRMRVSRRNCIPFPEKEGTVSMHHSVERDFVDNDFEAQAVRDIHATLVPVYVPAHKDPWSELKYDMWQTHGIFTGKAPEGPITPETLARGEKLVEKLLADKRLPKGHAVKVWAREQLEALRHYARAELY